MLSLCSYRNLFWNLRQLFLKLCKTRIILEIRQISAIVQCPLDTVSVLLYAVKPLVGAQKRCFCSRHVHNVVVSCRSS